MPKITITSLERRIQVLESEKQTLGGQLSINGEYQLATFKVLLMLLRGEEEKMNACEHDYFLHLVDGVYQGACIKCGKAYGVA